MSHPDSRIPDRALSVAAFLVPVLVFVPAFFAGFAPDDEGQVLSNPAVRDFDLAAIFGRGYWANATGTGFDYTGSDLYRPLTTLSVSISYQLFGENPLGYHVENVLLHALATWLVFGLLTRWGFARAAALFGSLLFGVVPIHIEPVASIILRNELLAAIFSCIALRSVVRAGSVDLRIIAPVAFFAALLSKESAVALPALVFLADWLLVRPDREQWKARLSCYALMGVAMLVYLVVRFAVIGQLGLGKHYFDHDNELVVWLTMARFAIDQYLSGALLGTPIVFDYSRYAYADAAPSSLWAWTSLLLWVALTASSIYFAWRRRARWTFGPLFFLLAMAPTANVLVRIGVLGATRLVYLPYLGIAVLLVQFLAILAKRLGTRPCVVIGVLLLAGYVVQTERRLHPWRHPIALQLDIIEQVPQNGYAWVCAGHIAWEIAVGKKQPPADEPVRSRVEWLATAFAAFDRGLRLDPRHWGSVQQGAMYTAFHTRSEHRLMALLDAALRESAPGLPPLPQQGWEAKQPMAESDYRILTQWAQALQPLTRDADPRVVSMAELGRLMPDFVAYRARFLAVQALCRVGQREQAEAAWRQAASHARRAGNAAAPYLRTPGPLFHAAQHIQQRMSEWRREARRLLGGG